MNSKFIRPTGINFSSYHALNAVEMSNILREIVGFIRKLEINEPLERYDDWWEHDGLHFYRGNITIEELLDIVSTPLTLQNEMTTDFYVFIGVAPKNNDWYLRFYLDEDELVGRFDVTFSSETSKLFRGKMLPETLKILTESNSESYYDSIIL